MAAHRILPILVTLTIMVHSIQSYPDGAPRQACGSLQPRHSHRRSGELYQSQESAPPFNLSISRDNFNHLNDTLKVQLRANRGHIFKGFLIQARRTHAEHGDTEVPVGHFEEIPGTKSVCGNPSIGTGLTHDNSDDKTEVTLTWHPHDPLAAIDPNRDPLGHIQFWVTIVQNHRVFWADQPSAIILDPAAPPLPTTPPPIVDVDINGCGVTKGCYRNPPECKGANCDIIITWTDKQRRYIDFEMSADIDGWVALGLSHDKKMGNDDVTECVWNDETGVVEVRKSFNADGDKANYVLADPQVGLYNMETHKYGAVGHERILCRFSREKVVPGNDDIFDLTMMYHLLMVKGKVDKQGKKFAHQMEAQKYPYVSPGKVSLLDTDDISGTCRYILVKVHACLMLIGWMMCCSTAILLAKYYKPMWPSDRICKQRVWFAVHRGCQITNLLCTVIAFILIFVHVGGWSWMPELPNKAHPILGIITVCLCVLNPLIALCRPSNKARRRPVFNWIHWFIGTVAIVLATPTIFIGLNLPKAHVPWWATWVLVAFMLWHLITELMLEIHGCMNSKKQKMRNEEFELRKKTDSRGDYYGLEPEPVGTNFKKRILGLYLLVVIVLGLVMVITVAVS